MKKKSVRGVNKTANKKAEGASPNMKEKSVRGVHKNVKQKL
jgi:hypothetical protein